MPSSDASVVVREVELDDASGTASLELSVPSLGDGALLSDGVSRAYDGQFGDSISPMSVVVQPTEQSTRALIVIEDSGAPQEYQFELGGEVAELEQDPETGEVLGLNAQGDVVAVVDAAWARADDGESIDTWYEIDGTTLTQVIHHGGRMAYPIVADPDLFFFAKCAGGIAYFAAENAAWMAKFWKVFKSAKALVKMFKSIRKMSKSGKINYIRSKLGSIASEMSGFGDLVSRCTP